MDSIGRQIVASSKAALSASEGGKALDHQRDLLSVLLRSTLSKEVPENQRLSEAEVVARKNQLFLAFSDSPFFSSI
jgi:hypothetical protein